MMYWYGGHGMGAWGWTLMTLSLLVFWGVLIAIGIALFRAWNRNHAPTTDRGFERPEAEQILAERFARGEIDDSEFRERSATLREHTRG